MADTPTKTTLNNSYSLVREEDLVDLETLRGDLTRRVDQARSDGRIYMMQQYTILLATVSAEVDRVNRRFNRETLAAHRKEAKRLRREAKEQAAQAAANASA